LAGTGIVAEHILLALQTVEYLSHDLSAEEHRRLHEELAKAMLAVH
jgi:hypothetical protein